MRRGSSARDIRAHTEETLTKRFGLVRDLFAARAPGTGRIWEFVAARTAFLAPRALLDLVLPDGRAAVVRGARRSPCAWWRATSTPSRPSVLVGRAPSCGGREHCAAGDLRAGADRRPQPDRRRPHQSAAVRPHRWERRISWWRSTCRARRCRRPRVRGLRRSRRCLLRRFCSSAPSCARSCKPHQPDIYIDAGTGHFQALEFLKVRDILAAAEPAKDDLRTKLERALARSATPRLRGRGYGGLWRHALVDAPFGEER